MTLFYKSVVVLVAGPIGSGKTTFSDMLNANLTGKGLLSVRVPLAGPIKFIATHFMGWDGNKDERGRKLLQTLGTECGRTYNPDVWVSYLIDTYIPHCTGYPFDVIIIDDWRFPNEREYIEKNGLYDVVAIKLIRDCAECNDHISEKSLPQEDSYYSTIIHNAGDLYALQRSAIATSEYLINKYDKGVK